MDFVKGDMSIRPENGMTLAYNSATQNYQPTGAINLGVDHGRKASGNITLDANHATHILGLTGLATIKMGPPKFLGQVVSLIVVSGGANAVIKADDFPKGDIVLDDRDMVNFVAVSSSTWWAYGTGAPPAPVVPDTTAPSQPGLTVTTTNDTSVVLSVTRGQDEESTPTLQGRYYPSSTASTARPAFSTLSLGSGGTWTVNGLIQNTPYTFEAQEVSKGGTSPATSLQVTTAKTKGWIVSSSLNLNVPDGTDPSTLKMTDGQSVTDYRDFNEAKMGVSNKTLIYPTVTTPVQGASQFIFPTTATTKLTRVRATYSFAPGTGANTTATIFMAGAYPLGALGLCMKGDGSLMWDLGGSNTVWGTPTWTKQTGFNRSGTFSIVLDSDNYTLSAYVDGVSVGTVMPSTAGALPGVSAGRLALSLWGGGSLTLSEFDVMTYQS